MQTGNVHEFPHPIPERVAPRFTFGEQPGDSSQPQVGPEVAPAWAFGTPRIGDSQEPCNDQRDVQHTQLQALSDHDRDVYGQVRQHQQVDGNRSQGCFLI